MIIGRIENLRRKDDRPHIDFQGRRSATQAQGAAGRRFENALRRPI
jgi:hypothetical protein